MSPSERSGKRSYPCNAELLVRLRERKGWTQQELADEAGYSERLINKAESGRPLSTSTIEVLAETLSTPEDRVYFEDLVCDPIALAKEYMAALYTQGNNLVSSVRHFLDEDIVLRVSGDPAIIPFAGEHRGVAEVERAYAIFFSILEAPKDHDHTACYSYVAQGNDVILWGESWIHPIGFPAKKPVSMTHRLRFRRGKLVEFEDIFDTLSGINMLREAGIEVPPAGEAVDS